MDASARARTLWAWLVLFATPLIWTAHLALLYGIASLEITLRREAGAATWIASLLVTIAALVAIALLGRAMHAQRLPAPERVTHDVGALWHRAGTFLAVLSFLGVLWQGLVAFAVPGSPSSHHALWGGTAPPTWVHRERATDTGTPEQDAGTREPDRAMREPAPASR